MNFLEKIFRAAWAPPDRRPIYESLADYLTFGAESPYQGAFDIHNSPWIKEPLDELLRDDVRRVSVSGAAQLAKTMMGLIFVIWIILKRPGLTTWNSQTKDAATKVCEDKAWPLFQRCKPLTDLLPANRHKVRTRSIVFPHMSFRVQTAAENNAHSDTVLYQINDERHLWPAGLIHKFLSRVGSMPNHKVLDLSTGSIKLAEEKREDGTIVEIGDDFFQDWHAGSQGVWHVRCPHCQRRQPLVFSHRDKAGKPLLDGQRKPIFGFVWDENETTRPGGRWNWTAVRRTARWKCQADRLGIPHPAKIVKRGGAKIRQVNHAPACSFELEDTADNVRSLNSLAAGAGYVHMNPLAPADHKTFRYPAMVSELVGWGKLVVEWLRAIDAKGAGDLGPLKTFIQNRLGEAWDESVAFETVSNPTGDYELGDDWRAAALDGSIGELLEDRRFLTIDMQEKGGRHYWALCRAWSRDGRSRLVWFGKLNSWDECRAKQHELAVTDKRTLIDTGDGNSTAEAYEQCIKYGWTAMKGEDVEDYRHPNPRNPRKPIKRLYSGESKGDPGLGRKKLAPKFARQLKKAARRVARIGRYARLFRWSNPGVKDILARLISGNGKYWGRPSNEDPDYTEQLNSEVKKHVRDKRGRFRWMWMQIKADNHARDLEAMQLVAALMSGLITAEPEPPPEPGDPKVTAAAAALANVVATVKAAVAASKLFPPKGVPASKRTYRLDPPPSAK